MSRDANIAEPTQPLTFEEHRVKCAMDIYVNAKERAALRCALGDAAHLCDLIGKGIEQENKGRGGKGLTTKVGRERAAIAKRCGDAIWAMRDLI